MSISLKYDNVTVMSIERLFPVYLLFFQILSLKEEKKIQRVIDQWVHLGGGKNATTLIGLFLLI